VNVLHIDEQRGWRGGEQQAAYLIRGLAKRGWRNVIAGRPGSRFLTDDHGGAVLERIAAPFLSEVDPYTIWLLSRAIKRHDIDIVHAHTSHAHFAACAVGRFSGRVKIIVSRRVDFAPRSGAFNRWKYSWPDRIVAISEAIASVMRNYGVPDDRLSVVHSATDSSRFNLPPLPREELGVPEDAMLLGNVAALVGHKDHATLLEATSIASRDLPKLRVLIAGEGELRPQLEERIGRLGLENIVRLLGQRSDVPRLLRTFDAFALSSEQEGLGTSILDAMVCGLPIVATASGGIPEMVRHEETGLLSLPHDSSALAVNIVRVFSDRDLALRLAEKARAMVDAQYCVDAMVEGNIRVYEELLGR
jgi:glycosyltransferase involved in cell wall biosynthesis